MALAGRPSCRGKLVSIAPTSRKPLVWMASATPGNSAATRCSLGSTTTFHRCSAGSTFSTQSKWIRSLLSRSKAAWNLRLCVRSEEHTSELQSLTNLVCRLLLEKKKKKNKYIFTTNEQDKRTVVTIE